MEMHQLRYFLAAIKHGNIGRAAKELNITQPALSRSIKNLESDLGAQLLERGPKGVQPTVFGNSLREHAQVIVSEAERAADEVRVLQGLGKGQVTVGISANFAGYVVPDAIARLLEQNPQVNVVVHTGLFDQILTALRRTEADLAFTLIPPDSEDNDLVIEPLIESKSRLYARADHPLIKQKKITLKDLSEYGWVVPQQLRMGQFFNRKFRGRNVPIPRQVIKTTSIAFLKPVMLATGLLSVLPDHMVREEVKDGRIVCVDPDLVTVSRTAGIVTRAVGSRPPAVSAFVEALVQVCNESNESDLFD